jgi:hypothetical protein
MFMLRFTLLLRLYAQGRQADVVNQNKLQCQIDASSHFLYYTAAGRSQIVRLPIHHHVASPGVPVAHYVCVTFILGQAVA